MNDWSQHGLVICINRCNQHRGKSYLMAWVVELGLYIEVIKPILLIDFTIPSHQVCTVNVLVCDFVYWHSQFVTLAINESGNQTRHESQSLYSLLITYSLTSGKQTWHEYIEGWVHTQTQCPPVLYDLTPFRNRVHVYYLSVCTGV